MLQTIKKYIEDLPDKNFGEFYQEYIMKVEDDIVNSDVRSAELQWAGASSANEILSGINMLTEELNGL